MNDLPEHSICDALSFARRVGACREKVLELARSGRIRSLDACGRRFFYLEDVDEARRALGL